MRMPEEASRGGGMAHGPTEAQSVSGTVVCKAGQSAGWVGRKSHGKGLWTRLWAR